jgi:hypothetical protein
VRFHRSAFKHGISIERCGYVVEHCARPLYPPAIDVDPRVVFLGPDINGVPLEVVGIEDSRGEILVIHAMGLRKKYLNDYAREMECR